MELELWEEDPESKKVEIAGSGGRVGRFSVVHFGDTRFRVFMAVEVVFILSEAL